MIEEDLRKLDVELRPVAPWACGLIRQAADELARSDAAGRKDTAAMLSLAVSSNELLGKHQKVVGGLERLVRACYPIDMWMGGIWANPPSDGERHEFVLALSEAMSLVQPGDTTSEPPLGPA